MVWTQINNLQAVVCHQVMIVKPARPLFPLPSLTLALLGEINMFEYFNTLMYFFLNIWMMIYFFLHEGDKVTASLEKKIIFISNIWWHNCYKYILFTLYFSNGLFLGFYEFLVFLYFLYFLCIFCFFCIRIFLELFLDFWEFF